MFIDSSAIVAIIENEAGFESLIKRMAKSERPVCTSPLARFEATIAIARKRSVRTKNKTAAAASLAAAEMSLGAFIADGEVKEVSVTPEIGAAARAAAARFGKRSGHPARLNFGDCFSYACAKTLGVPLLYVGEDFAKTDLA